MNSIILSKINKISYKISYSSYHYCSHCITLRLKTSIPPYGYLYSLWNKYFYFMGHQDSKFYKYVDIYDPFFKYSNLPLLNLTEGDYILVSKNALTKEDIWDILSMTNDIRVINILTKYI